MFRYWVGIIFLCVTLPWMARANFSGGDDFNDNSVDPTKWSTDEVRNFGTYTETNQRLEYTAAMPQSTLGIIFHHWTGNYGSYTQNWSAQVDIHLASPSLTGSDYLFIGLAVADVANPSVNLAGPILQETNTGYNLSFQFASSTPRVEPWPSTPVPGSDVSLQITYDAAIHSFIESYDIDGAANGYQWVTGYTYDVSPWGMNASSQFELELVTGGMMYTGSRTVTSGQVTADNLVMTPEPSSWILLLGGLSCLVAARRYKKIRA